MALFAAQHCTPPLLCRMAQPGCMLLSPDRCCLAQTCSDARLRTHLQLQRMVGRDTVELENLVPYLRYHSFIGIQSVGHCTLTLPQAPAHRITPGSVCKDEASSPGSCRHLRSRVGDVSVRLGICRASPCIYLVIDTSCIHRNRAVPLTSVRLAAMAISGTSEHAVRVLLAYACASGSGSGAASFSGWAWEHAGGPWI